MAWHRPGNKPLSEPMMVNLLMHICLTQPQWVNSLSISYSHINHNLYRGILSKGPCVSMACRALLAGYPCYEEFLFLQSFSCLIHEVIQNINQYPIYIYASRNKIVHAKLINPFCTQHSNPSIVHFRSGCCHVDGVDKRRTKSLNSRENTYKLILIDDLWDICFCLFVFLEE